MGNMMGFDHRVENDIKWPNGLTFFNALTGRSDDAKLLFNAEGIDGKLDGGSHQNLNQDKHNHEEGKYTDVMENSLESYEKSSCVAICDRFGVKGYKYLGFWTTLASASSLAEDQFVEWDDLGNQWKLDFVCEVWKRIDVLLQLWDQQFYFNFCKSGKRLYDLYDQGYELKE
ncbi:hypothetical protein L6452_09284 [Arctium lappa]|uniref:Uncharacterized protein n=1 Tax=Arctium lappa TaxID=4217 RepID=A0ACB9DJV2_ARCLA|nr:hypothetical protein L6452_09284 [Arctium lappa]